ncbi:hypothetical protein AB0368_37510 [Actinoplanes sp. NPDC051475]|uniref:hypothetical protein n=1 Tax=Actinoplanes sp. NPDC051475 TaxID=3157225 RepID=UPI00344F613E
MINSSFQRVVGLAITAAWVVGSSSGCAGLFSSFGGCTDHDKRIIAELTSLPIVTAHPDGAVPIGSSWACDTDNGVANVSQRYQSELDRKSVLSFYRAAAKADGWQLDGKDPSSVPSAGSTLSGVVECFRKEIDSATVYLKVWFLSDFTLSDDPKVQESDDDYGLDASGSHDGTAGC